jgi:uncharacterized repeat protein (TIGR02543 family)
MKKIKIGFFVGSLLLGLSLVGCSKKTTKNTTTAKSNTTTKPNATTKTNTTTAKKVEKVNVIFDSNGGSPVDSQSVEKGTYVTKPNDPKLEGYTFVGWYYNDSEWIFDSNTASSDITLKANWSINKYSITLDNQATGVTISGITSGNEYDYNSEITLTATNIPDGYTVNWSINGEVVSTGDAYAFNVPADNITITTTTIAVADPYTRSGNKIYFGTYPQTLVTDDTLTNELNTLAGTLPTATDAYSWTDYNYYIAGYIISYMFYQDIDYDNDGINDYRGVYFIQYRPYKAASGLDNADDSHQDENGYTTNTVYWFSYDPIEWNILTESDGKALIIANLILDAQDYYPSQSPSQFSHNDGTGYANNYELSSIRKWLNNDFYNTAFNVFQKAIIKETEQDNSVASTGQTSNDYVCNNTKDKVFLLSCSETATYYEGPTDWLTYGTDYAKVQGLLVYDVADNHSDWWMRSPYFKYGYIAYGISGYADSEFAKFLAHCTCIGVRPACWIKL